MAPSSQSHALVSPQIFLEPDRCTMANLADILDILPDGQSAADFVQGHVDLVLLLSSVTDLCRMFN